MRPKELLNVFVFFLPSGRLPELHCDPSGLDATLRVSISPFQVNAKRGVLAEDTPTLRSEKRVFDTRGCTVIMTYIVLEMYAIYIILMNLPY